METKQCAVCNKKFSPCNKCLKLNSNNKDIVQWRQTVCCRSHFAFYIPIDHYKHGIINKEQAKKELQIAFNYYGDIDFNDNAKLIVDEIMSG